MPHSQLWKTGAFAAILTGITVCVTAAIVSENSRNASAPTTILGIDSSAEVRPAARSKPIRRTAARKRPTLVAQVTARASTLLAAIDQPNITDRHKELAQQTLMTLPSGCRDHLKNFAILYKNATNRGLGGKTTIILDGSVPDDEFVALLTHECGHVISGNLVGSMTTGSSPFSDGSTTFYNDSPSAAFWTISWSDETSMRSSARSADFVSGYAKSDMFEDFAETFAAYILQRDMLRERAKTNNAIKAKLAWMEQYLPTNESLLGTSTYTWDKKVPWDVTKLAYTPTLPL